ncbi:MAG: 2-amino-4-hydroxy-6-hydroxymethyldihydropteridine diphosphokinase [Nitrospiria bacterium]
MIAFVGLGSNLGNRREILQRAVLSFKKLNGTKVVDCSSFYETEPVGAPGSPSFLNAVVKIDTGLSARELLTESLLIEEKEGRVRTALNAPRTLDIDLLFFGHHVIEDTDLTIPHPRLHLRKFTLIPLVEIAPELIHPSLKISVSDLLINLKSSEKVSKVSDDLTEMLKIR